MCSDIAIKPDELITDKLENTKLSKLSNEIKQDIIGQDKLIDFLIVALLCEGHVLIEGMPGLCKTTVAKKLADSIEGKYHRIQFTPDLLPADLIGTDIYLPESQSFSFKSGPIFQNILLADEINRAPAKVQSALLEAMAERQVTVGQSTYNLPELFMVIATQNPIEQEGTYNLPEAQLDRFMMKCLVDYPSHNEELSILDLKLRKGSKFSHHINKVTTQQEILQARKAAQSVYLDDKLKEYIVSLLQATRNPKIYSSELQHWITHGASPRASIALMQCSKAYAWLQGDEYVSPAHIQALIPSILRHRIGISYEAEAEGIDHEQIINLLLNYIAVP